MGFSFEKQKIFICEWRKRHKDSDIQGYAFFFLDSGTKKLNGIITDLVPKKGIESFS